MNSNTARRDREVRSDVDDLIRAVKGLVRAPDSVRRAGASSSELEDRGAEIRRLQRRLAERVRRDLLDGTANPAHAPRGDAGARPRRHA